MTSARAVERRIVTVLFADLVGFTTLSEQLDAEDVALVQDAYFEAVRETIGRHGGQLEKYIGDAVMGVFGVPRVRDDDAERAVRAGLALVAAVERLGAELGLEDGALRLRVGVNSGETLFGEASAERGPVTGDVVNTAARLQAAAAPGTVVAGELTAFSVADAARLEPLDALELKGKAEPVRAFRVAGLFAERSRARALGRLRAPTLGRDAELERLETAIGDGPAWTVVVAPPGTGKSRLLAELAARAQARDAVVLQARVRPDALGPYEAAAQLVRAAGGGERLRAAATATSAARREALLRALEPLEGEEDVGGVAGSERRERDAVFADWLEALDLLAEGRPSVWLVEDVHWGSGDLHALLAFAGAASCSPGRLVVATARPSFLDREAAREAPLLELRPLDDGVTAALVRALVGDALPGELVARIVAAADGNPLFVEELLRMWADVGVLRDEEGAWRLAVAPDSVPLPATVQAIYAAQLDDLPDIARTAARRAAVAGRRFPRAACAPLEIDDADTALDILARRALVDGPHEDVLLGDSYAYRHALLRDAGYASLAKGERASLHCRLADWLAGLRGASASLAEVIGRHYAAAAESAPALVASVGGRTRAELRTTAAGWFERAADAALRIAAWDSARGLAERSLELDPDAGPVTRGRRLELQAEATASAVGADPAIALYELALERYREALADQPEAARAGIGSAGLALGTLLRAQTWFTRAEHLADSLLEEIGETAEPRPRAQLLLLRASSVLNASDDYARAERDAAAALDLARSGGDRSLELDAEHLLALIASERDGSVAPVAWERIEALGRAEGRWSSVAGALRARAAPLIDDDSEAALELIERSAEVCATHGLVEGAAWCDHGRAEIAFVRGEWPHALEAGLRAVDAGERHGFHRVVVRSWFVLLPIARCLRRTDLIEQAHARFAARRGREPDSPYARIVTTAAHLELAAIGLEPAFVPSVAERLPSFDGAHGGPSWLAALQTVVDAWLAAGELDAAAEALDRMAASHGSTSLARATEAILRARLLLGRDDAARAAAQAERALGLLADRAPWWCLRALEALAAARPGDERARTGVQEISRRLGLPA